MLLLVRVMGWAVLSLNAERTSDFHSLDLLSVMADKPRMLSLAHDRWPGTMGPSWGKRRWTQLGLG
jgi:hypothetical protein